MFEVVPLLALGVGIAIGFGIGAWERRWLRQQFQAERQREEESREAFMSYLKDNRTVVSSLTTEERRHAIEVEVENHLLRSTPPAQKMPPLPSVSPVTRTRVRSLHPTKGVSSSEAAERHEIDETGEPIQEAEMVRIDPDELDPEEGL